MLLLRNGASFIFYIFFPHASKHIRSFGLMEGSGLKVKYLPPFERLQFIKKPIPNVSVIFTY